MSVLVHPPQWLRRRDRISRDRKYQIEIDLLEDTVVPIIASVVTSLSNWMTSMQETGTTSGVFDTIRNAIAAVPGVLKTLNGYLAQVLVFLQPLTDAATTFGTIFVNAMVGAGTAIADYLGSPTVMAFLEGLQTLLGALATTVRDVLVLAFQGAAIAWQLLSDAFTIAWPYIQTVLDTFFSLVTIVMAAVSGILKTLSKLVTGDFMGAWTTLKNSVRSTLEDLWGFFQTLKIQLMTFFVEIKPEVLKLGTNMIQGVADGISSGAKWVKDALMAAARAAWSAVTSFFGGGGDGEGGETVTGSTSRSGLITNTNGQNITMNLTANYSNMQSESSLIADARAWMMTMGRV